MTCLGCFSVASEPIARKSLNTTRPLLPSGARVWAAETTQARRQANEWATPARHKAANRHVGVIEKSGSAIVATEKRP
jgi:hypothetical protein